VAFSQDGKTLASGSDDDTVRLWDVAGHRMIASPLTGHTDSVTSVAFSPDGKTLASGSQDKTVRLWDVAGHRQIGTPLTGHTDYVDSVAFSPDGTTLASGSDDDTVRLWNSAQLVDPASFLCRSVGQSFSRDWQSLVPEGPKYRPLCP
jgi:WD40 repeat protein